MKIDFSIDLEDFDPYDGSVEDFVRSEFKRAVKDGVKKMVRDLFYTASDRSDD